MVLGDVGSGLLIGVRGWWGDVDGAFEQLAFVEDRAVSDEGD